jgi:hypothetical protein
MAGAFVSYAFNFSFYLGIATSEKYRLMGPNANDFLIMLNPLPGFMTGWYGEMQTRFIVQHNVPSSSWGIIWALGFWSSQLCMIAIAFILAFLDSISVTKNMKFVLIALCAIFVVFFAQYTLRSSFRFIWYSLFIIMTLYSYKVVEAVWSSRKDGH